MQVLYWESRLRTEYQEQTLTKYQCQWDTAANRPGAISEPQYHDHPYPSPQLALFDPLWVRHPVEAEPIGDRPLKQVAAGGHQMRFYFGPELVR